MDYFEPCLQVPTITYTVAGAHPLIALYKAPTHSWTKFRVTSGQVKNWKQNIALGIDATTLLTGFHRTVAWEPAVEVLHSDVDVYRFYGYNRAALGGYAYYSQVDWFIEPTRTEAVDSAAVAFVKSYRKAMTKWSSLQFVGELRESVHELKRPAALFCDLTKGLLDKTGKLIRRHRLKNITDSQLLKLATDNWLGYQLGVKPLVSDIQNAQNALSKRHEDGLHGQIRFIGSGRGFKDYGPLVVTCGSNLGLGAPGNPGFWCNDYALVNTTCTMIGGLRVAGNEVPYLDSLGLTHDQWIPTVYELIPYSWLADYVSNLGQVIDGYSFCMVNLSWSVKTIRQEYRREVTNIHTAYVSDPRDGAYGGRVLDRHFLVQRTPIGDNFVPSLRLKLPGLGQDLNIAALVNGLTSQASWPRR